MDNWIGVAALAVSIVVGIFGYVSRPTFVPAARVQELRSQINELRAELEQMKAERDREEARARQLLGEVEFWREEYRRLRGTQST